jgi:acetyl-CoA carboxylase carboxyltransferase component
MAFKKLLRFQTSARTELVNGNVAGLVPQFCVVEGMSAAVAASTPVVTKRWDVLAGSPEAITMPPPWTLVIAIALAYNQLHDAS